MDVWENPFSTSRVRPGAMPYLFLTGESAAGESAAALVDRLAAAGWRGEIIGPHGCGKSTLLASLLPELAQHGRPTLAITLHAGQRTLPHSWSQLATSPPASVIVVDGYEQTSRWTRWRLARLCRRHGFGLLVTSHQPTGLPTLATLQPNLATCQRVVKLLLANRPELQQVVTPQTIAEAFQSSRGNLRETLFRLYDIAEQTRHNETPTAGQS